VTETEQRKHWAKEYGLFVSILAALMGYGVAGLWWAGNLNHKVESMQVRQSDYRDRLSSVENGRIIDNQAIARLEERMAAQQASIERVENIVNDILIFLRENDR